ncbi:DNA/RNA polymerases superfamily protein [Gossypium australe]|uniref:DNA/RNA polymerases superfamily protein n=1 Tax=Gossypium australe TaxID=47621 RepID=A0A5B6W8B0_9ROSI|nr:DNA/RNA polymerases superfamily protein [Gossypium australe]
MNERSEVRALARSYVIKACEDAIAPNICKSCPLKVQGYNFPSSLMLLPFDDFDLIFRMDWLSEHDVIGKWTNCTTNVVSALLAQKLIRKRCETYLAYVLDSKVVESKIDQVPIVKEYDDVFPEELPGLPLIREVEFVIELVPGTTPISIAPYMMASTESKELKVKLQELLDREFIRSSVSPWGAPVLFVKKKDGSMRLCIDYR